MSSTEETPSSDVAPNNDTNSISTSTSDSSQLESLPSNDTTSSNEVNQPMTGISKKRKANEMDTEEVVPVITPPIEDDDDAGDDAITCNICFEPWSNTGSH